MFDSVRHFNRHLSFPTSDVNHWQVSPRLDHVQHDQKSMESVERTETLCDCPGQYRKEIKTGKERKVGKENDGSGR